MNRTFVLMISMLATLSTAHAATTAQLPASEPAYCNPEKFAQFERGNNLPGLDRVHVYQIGQLTLAGLAVGQSQISSTESLAMQYGQFAPEEKSCTWYYNSGNPSAEVVFNHHYLPMPWFWGGPEGYGKQYEAVLSSSFDQDPTNFVSCATQHKYLAMGCDGMQHRGPSAFAMFLSFTGCSPEHSVEIVNKIWGSNFVPTSIRLAIAQHGYDMGSARNASREALQTIMTTPLH